MLERADTHLHVPGCVKAVHGRWRISIDTQSNPKSHPTTRAVTIGSEDWRRGKRRICLGDGSSPESRRKRTHCLRGSRVGTIYLH